MAKGQQRDGRREAFWREALTRQRQSGLNVRQWCAGQRLPETAFYFWRRTLVQRDRQAARAPGPVRQRLARQLPPQAVRQRSPHAAFVPVTVAMPGRESRIVIRLRDGRAMELPPELGVQRVAELVHAIENRPALSLPAVSLSNQRNGPARVEGVAS